MGFFGWRRNAKVRDAPDVEERSETTVTAEEALLTAIIGSTDMTKDKMLQIPVVQACLNKILGTVCSLPIKLYHRKEDGRVEEVTDDRRLRLLNIDTGDTLSTDEFWRNMIEDYYLGHGGYAYIHKGYNGEFLSIHHVEEEKVCTVHGVDPIFKEYNIMVQGETYPPHRFLKIHRRTREGAAGVPLYQENSLVFSVAYATFVFEEMLVKKGGNKRGFIEAENKLSKEAIQAIKTAWVNMFSTNTDKVVVLNDGAKFKESSNTSVEMQLNENKQTNAREICATFGFPQTVLYGKATESDRKEFLQAVTALLNTIETALDRDLLRESEKGSFYFAFDTRELTRGDIAERYKAYGVALEHNFLKVDEVREMEDREPFGFDWLKIGLDSVLLDVENKTVYTANTNTVAHLGKGVVIGKAKEGGEGDES